jgi:hypothetical protein
MRARDERRAVGGNLNVKQILPKVSSGIAIDLR